MNQEFWGIPVKFERFEKVIIDCAEVKGTVVNIKLNSFDGYVMYGVAHQEGAIHTSSGYQGYETWFYSSELRKIKPKQPSLLKRLLNKFNKKH